MVTKKAGLFLIFGLFLTEFIVLVPRQKIAVAKPQSSVGSQSSGNQRKNQDTTETEDIAQPRAITETLDQKEDKEDKDNKGRINSETHRSTVASFVQSLLTVADREGGIGDQVKVIAQQQNDSKEKSVEAINKIEKRNKIKTFLLGTDYKNLGTLRSEMVKTRNSIEQLKRLVEKAKIEENKTELQTKIQNLEKEQAAIDSFISQNESKFSLFGWAAKLFIK